MDGDQNCHFLLAVCWCIQLLCL